VLTIIGFASILPLYLATGIAILRYRLYEIDIIIRRTLQYTLVTGLLVMVYFGSIVLLQSVLRSLTGEVSQVAIVISTLGIAALFNPLRLRVQGFIDQRFYRHKYNAEQAMMRFAAVAREDVKMENLSAAMVQVAEETMQPLDVSLWLTNSKRGG
jgi:hypothetical protein